MPPQLILMSASPEFKILAPSIDPPEDICENCIIPLNIGQSVSPILSYN